MSDWGLEWELPEYPQLPKLFTNAKTAKKRKHKEFILTDELLNRPVKLPKITGDKQRKSEVKDKQQQQVDHVADVPDVQPPTTMQAQQTDGQIKTNKEKKVKKKKQVVQQQDAPARPQQTPASVTQADTQGASAASPPAADAVLAPKRKKKGKNKFKQPEFLAQQAQQQHLKEQQQQRASNHKQQAAGLDQQIQLGSTHAMTLPAVVAEGDRPVNSKQKHKKLEQQQQQQQQQVKSPEQSQPAQSPAAVQESKSARKRQQQQQQQQQHLQQPVLYNEQQLASPPTATTAEKNHGKKQKKHEQQQQVSDKPAQQQQQRHATPVTKASASPAAIKPSGGITMSSSGGGSKLLQQFKDRLSGSRFRQLNEALYTQPGDDSFTQMQEQPELFNQYHEGFQQQVKSWPTQPLDVAIKWLQDKPQDFVVADYGCGEARLAATVKQKVQSLDLVAAAPGVIACNMAHTPLDTDSCDAAVFSLALMGTDYGEFLLDAARVLKKGGWLWIAEVRSRFAAGNGCEDFRPFLSCLRQLGFQLVKQDAKNKMFVVFVLKKHLQVDAAAARGVKWPALKACVYKKR